MARVTLKGIRASIGGPTTAKEAKDREWRKNLTGSRQRLFVFPKANGD
jgi:hypothetical protein